MLCGQSAKPLFLQGGTGVLWCSTCELGLTVPEPRVDYTAYTTAPRDEQRWDRFSAAAVRFVLDAVGDVGTWLDFGAGSGELVTAVERAGVEALGVDLDDGARRLAATRGASIVPSLDDVGDRTFTIVSASHTIEHVADPVATLRALGRFLEPSGHLLVVQPDFRGLLPRVITGRWNGWGLDQHFWHFSPRSMAIVFARAGLRPVAVQRNSLWHPLALDRRLPFSLLARVGQHAGLGDQFYMLGRLA